MPDKGRGDLIREHGEQIVSLVTRIDQLVIDLSRIEKNAGAVQEKLTETTKLIQGVETRLTIIERDAARLEKRLDDLLFRRWELAKLILAAVFAVVAGLIGGFLGKLFDHPGFERPRPNAPSVPSPGKTSHDSFGGFRSMRRAISGVSR